MNVGMKNRGKAVEDIEKKRKAVEKCIEVKLADIASYSIDSFFDNKNNENTIEAVKLQHGYVGSVKINSDLAKGESFVSVGTAGFGTMFTIRCWLSLISRESVTQSK